jgi:predicted Fe-S protein YdhL (DUF1289 family)
MLYLASPCIKFCVLHLELKWCKGCGRTSTEIKNWSDSADIDKHNILVQLPARLGIMKEKEC